MVLQRVAGVDDADVSFEAGRAVVTYDPELTAPAQFIAELERMTGFEAEVMGAAADSVGPVGETGAEAVEKESM